MDALLVSTLVVALAEIGDKTQLLALVLAARYRRPGVVVLGIAIATLLNHALAAAVGAWLADWLPGEVLRWTVVASFIAVAAWTLVPDKLDDDEAPRSARGAFLATLVAFFLVEIGDKTQVATVVLAAQYTPMLLVVLGTTLGMLLANAPVVWLCARFADRLPLRAARFTAASVFLSLGLWIAWQGLPG
ncbi:MAG TPA: TMEM165/GDT1 family protein [Arenimonas sp.]|nr:TMEM165/GDT1 family protein [Arenimonas sp.]